MILASHQPLLFPWPGWFNKLAQADLFVLSDNVQFNRANFQHRNRIIAPDVCARTSDRWRWLSVPVRKCPVETLIGDVRIGSLDGDDWRDLHLRLLTESYRAAPFYDWLFPKLREFYAGEFVMLADVTIASVKFIAGLLGIETPLRLSSSFGPRPADRTERLVMMCRQAGADAYLCGLGGSQTYIDREQFRAAGVSLHTQVFAPAPYPQTGRPFIPYLSTLDLLFNCGPKSRAYINGGRL